MKRHFYLRRSRKPKMFLMFDVYCPPALNEKQNIMIFNTLTYL